MNPKVTIISPLKSGTTDAKTRIAAYCRVSTDSDDQKNSYMAQMRYYENFLSESRTEILVGVYADEGITGTRMDKREDFQRLLKDCRKGKIDRIIVKSISRFARNTKECLKVIRELKELGITIMFEKENIDTANLNDELIITIMGGLAQEESVSISNNLRWSCQKRMQNGTYEISIPPFAFYKENGELKINESEAEVVKQIFSLYINGMGIQSIALLLNEKGILSSQKKLWNAQTVKNVLTNERYIGDSVFQKYYVKESFPRIEVKNYGEKRKYYVENTNPPIVEKDVFFKAQELLKSRHNEYISNNNCLSGKINCDQCGSTFKYKKRRNNICFVCRKHDLSAELCSSKAIPQEKIHNAFIRLYNKLKSQYSVIFIPMLSQLQELKNFRYRSNLDYMNLSREIAGFKEQIHVLTRLRTKGFLSEAKFLEQSAEINVKIQNLEKERLKITKNDDNDEVVEQIKELASIIENSPLIYEFDEVIFESLVERIVVKNNAELEFQLYGGLKFSERIV